MTEAFIVVAVLMLPLFAGIAYGIGLGIRKREKDRRRREAGYKFCRACDEWFPPHYGMFHRHPLPKDEARYEAPSTGPFR